MEPRKQRAFRWPVLLGILVALAFGAWQVSATWRFWQHADILAGADYRIVTGAAARWLHGEGFYFAYQLAGPYDIKAMDDAWNSPVLYPPTMLLLFLPFTILPAFLWWAVPLTVTAYVIRRHEPRPLVWPVFVLLSVFPTTLTAIATGNPIMWLTMALALGTLYQWPSALLLLKPTIAPFALIGIWSRSWWIGLAGLVLVSLPFLPLWFDYLTVVANTGNSFGVLYSLVQWPMLFIPIIAWLGAGSRARAPVVR